MPLPWVRKGAYRRQRGGETNRERGGGERCSGRCTQKGGKTKRRNDACQEEIDAGIHEKYIAKINFALTRQADTKLHFS